MPKAAGAVGHLGFGHWSLIGLWGLVIEAFVHERVPHIHQLAGRSDRGGGRRAVAAGAVLPQAPPPRAECAVDTAVAQGHPGPPGQRAVPEVAAEPAAAAPDAPAAPAGP